MVFIVALCVPWCRHLEALPDVKPQLYADNLKCSAERPGVLYDSARFTARYVRAVGQDVSPGKCVLLTTSKCVRKATKLWDISGEGSFWKVQLDVRDLGGHLDFTNRARAGTLSCGVKDAIATVGAFPLGFQVKLGLVRGKHVPAGLHAAEASYASSSSHSAVRAAIVRAVWWESGKMVYSVSVECSFGILGCCMPSRSMWSHQIFVASISGFLILLGCKMISLNGFLFHVGILEFASGPGGSGRI